MTNNYFYSKEDALKELQKRMQSLDWENANHQREMRNIIREVLEKTSVEVDGKIGKTTVLYAGYIDSNSTSDIAANIKSDHNARILDKTEAF